MKKTWLLIMVLMLSLVALAACGGGGTAPVEEAPAEEAPAEGAAAEESTLIIAVDPDYETFDPSLAYEVYANMITHATYDTLVQYVGGDVENLQPGGAESYDISEDGLVYTFKLHEGMVFSSGNPVTAGDWKWSIERSKGLGGNGAFMTDGIASVEAPDDLTLVITLSETDPSFLTKLTYCLFAAIDKTVAEANGATQDPATDTAKTWFDANSAGSGPYVLESYTPKVELVLAKNENYWGEAPAYDKVIVKNVAEYASQVMMVQAGDIDVALNVDAEQAKQLASAEGVQVVDYQSLVISFLIMNCDPAYGPIADPLVQKAIRLAVDYQGIQAMAGEGTITPLAPFAVGLFGSVAPIDPATVTDIEAAKALMAQAGYADGFTVDFYVPTSTVQSVELLLLAQKVQNDLNQIGITTNIIPEDIMVSLETYRNGQQNIGLWYWSPDYPDNSSNLAFLPGQSVGLRANWQAEMNQELADLGAQAATESDPYARAELLAQIQRIMGEDSPFVVLCQFKGQFAARSTLTAAEYNDRYQLDLRTIGK